jgi:mannose-6-phosphate isomerase-like protein (cupin superfamily)
MPATRSHELVHLPELPGVACPCGTARRAFAERSDIPLTVHLTQIDQDARTHYHERLTEIYVVHRCEEGAAIELDGVRHPVRPGSAVLIPPGTRHRAVGSMEVFIFCTPKFDPADEHFDSPAA